MKCHQVPLQEAPQRDRGTSPRCLLACLAPHFQQVLPGKRRGVRPSSEGSQDIRHLRGSVTTPEGSPGLRSEGLIEPGAQGRPRSCPRAWAQPFLLEGLSISLQRKSIWRLLPFRA